MENPSYLKEIETGFELLVVKAASFPDGVLAAHQKLHGIVKPDDTRRYFGKSQGNPEGGIEYWAAVKKNPGDDPEALSLETESIPAGKYLCRNLSNYMANPGIIGQTFDEMVKNPEVDFENGFCLEDYLTMDEVICMVKLKDI